MNSISQFIKDWVPPLGVLAGGVWIIFKWLYDERLRKEKEIPSLDGKLSVSFVQLEHDKKLVAIEAFWFNRSPLPIYMDIHRCTIDIYKISGRIHEATAALTIKKDLGDPICSYKFLLNMVEVDYFFEPNAQSTIINHFVLPDGVYAARMLLHTGKPGILWWKEIVFDTKGLK